MGLYAHRPAGAGGGDWDVEGGGVNETECEAVPSAMDTKKDPSSILFDPGS